MRGGQPGFTQQMHRGVDRLSPVTAIGVSACAAGISLTHGVQEIESVVLFFHRCRH